MAPCAQKTHCTGPLSAHTAGHWFCPSLVPLCRCRCGRAVLVREQQRAGVCRRRGSGGFHPGAPGARAPRHQREKRKIPTRRPRRHAEGRRTEPQQLGSVGVLERTNTRPNCSARLGDSLRREVSKVSWCWRRQMFSWRRDQAVWSANRSIFKICCLKISLNKH